MSIINNGLLLASAAGAAPDVPGQISRSLRFNAPDSAFLSRTPASAGNRKTWTWSGWVKNAYTPNDYPRIFSAGPANNSGDNLEVTLMSSGDGSELRVLGDVGYTRKLNWTTAAKFRDPSAWFHLVVALDTTQATASNRLYVYVNGVRLTQAGASNTLPSQNDEFELNNTSPHYIGRYAASSALFFNGYLADIHFIDGQALDPSSFAETNATTGQWVPKAFSGGSYGTNGYRLTFSDNSGTTSTTLGKDAAGSNNWTPNNFSVASGSGNDSLTDSPTSYGTDTGAGGEVRGNYATFNPLAPSGGTFSNGNLDWASPATDQRVALSTISISTAGKWYCEYTIGSKTGSLWSVGIFGNPTVWSPRRQYRSDGALFDDGSQIATFASYTQGDVMGLAFDTSTSIISFYKNGVLQGTSTASPSAASQLYYFGCTSDSSGGSMNYSANFGQRAFAYTAPSGFKALVDTNLTAPVVAKPNTAFDVVTYTGNGSARSITLPGGFSPDLIWTKSRSAAYFHHLYDIVRGTNSDLCSNSTTNELTGSPYNDGVTAFNSSGYSLGTFNGLNENGTTYVAWAWDGGSSTVTNTQGSITSSVRANASAGFSIVSYTGTGSTATVGHGLNVAPSLIICKTRAAAVQWVVYHASLGKDAFLGLNTTDASITFANYWGSGVTSTVFGLQNLAGGNNNGSMIAYCFAPVSGYSSFGSYTGNGSTDGPFVFCNFRPRWIMVKGNYSGGDWLIVDTARPGIGTYNVATGSMAANLSNDEGYFGANNLDILSNGFKIRSSNAVYNTNTTQYLYMAFAENPFQYARAR